MGDIIEKLNRFDSSTKGLKDADPDLIQLFIENIEMGNKPKYLYKFSQINDNLFKLINKNSLYFNSVYNFNDPFDGRISIDYSEVSHSTIKDLPLDFSSVSENNLLDIFNKLEYYLATTSLISCFSTEDSSNTMWAHYADSHRGVCLEFDSTQDLEIFGIGDFVRYVSKMPSLKFPDNEKKLKQTMIFSKYDTWSYEKEYRILLYLSEQEIQDIYFNNLNKPISQIGQIRPFNKTALVSITFGCGIFDTATSFKYLKNVMRLILIVQRLYPHVKFGYAVKDKNKYELKFERNLSADDMKKIIIDEAHAKNRDNQYKRNAYKMYSDPRYRDQVLSVLQKSK